MSRGRSSGNGEGCMSAGGVFVLWQGSGGGGAAEQGRATFMHLL